MEKSNLTLSQFLLKVFINDCISLFNISREIEKPRHLHLSTIHMGLPPHKFNILIKQSMVSFIF